MTFASHDFRRNSACDCDECGFSVHVPPTILAALRERKRQKLEHGPLKRTQVRSLIQRGPDSVALWHWVLPQDAEPLVEFGSSHRIVWVKRLPKSSILRSIGKGIIGSSDEEKSRSDLGWQEGCIYLVPSNGGKAVGWIHHGASTRGDGEGAFKSDGHAELQIAKVPSDRLKDVRFLDDVQTTLPHWVATFMQFCQEGIDALGGSSTWHQYSKENSSKLMEAFIVASEPINQIQVEASAIPDPENPAQRGEGDDQVEDLQES